MQIPDAREFYNLQPDKGSFDKACNSVLRAMRKAQASNLRRTCFDPRPESEYDAVKAEFASKGYKFAPTGYIGGVWQRTEDICW